MGGKCSHDDSRLTCIDCNKPICSNCLVQCPVGFRCKGCGTVESGAGDSSKMAVAKGLGTCVIIGLGFGYAMPFIDLPWIGFIICYLVGLVAGRFLRNVLDHRLGHNTAKTIVFGLLIGMALSPLGKLPIVLFTILPSLFSAEHASVFGVLSGVVGLIFSPAIFMAGVLRPTVWGDRW